MLKLKPYCQIAGWIGAILLLVNFLFMGLSATPVLGWLPETVTGTGFLEDSRRRVAQAVEEIREGRLKQDARLGVFVGVSNLRESIQLAAITEGVGPGWRFLGVAGAGVGIGEVRHYADLVLESDLRPDVVVLGIGLHQMIDPRPRPRLPARSVLERVGRGEFRSAAIAVRDSTWIYARRQDVGVTVDKAVLELRARMFARLGVPLSQAESDELSPWREMVKADWPEHFSAATLRAQEESLAAVGTFDRETYENSPKAFSTLVDLVEWFRRRQATVILLLLPENSRLHARTPVEALDILKAQLGARFQDPPLLLDFRVAVDDSGFVDLPHMNHRGSLEFSRELAARLREALPAFGERLKSS